MMVNTVAPTPLLPPGLDLAGMTHKGRPNNEQALNAAANGFESVFMSLLIKQLRQTSDGKSLLFGKDSGDVLGGLFDHFMGQHLAQSGALGIAAMIKKYWQTQANHDQTNPGQATPAAGPLSHSDQTNQRNQVNRAYHGNARF